jgi:Protein of unknown function (DUF3237)
VQRVARTQSVEIPVATLLWQAAAEIGEREVLGASPLGQRFIVPILGGSFWGGPGHEDLHGRLLPGGADRQLLRADGVKELDALYEMQLDDGTVLTVRNRVLVDESRVPRYARSAVQVIAPAGRWDWLNRRCLVGSLQTLRPQAQAVLVNVFELQ